MAKAGPKTEQEWADWEREQKGLPPLLPPLTEAQRKAKDAQRNRVARQRDPNKRLKQPARKKAPVTLASVVDLKSVAPQQNQAAHQTLANPPAEPKPMGRNQLAWEAQIADYAEDNSGIVVGILTLASVLDDEERSAMWPTTIGKIKDLYLQLPGGGKRKSRSKGHLARVTRMTARTRAVNE